jgi:hypothetical protein
VRIVIDLGNGGFSGGWLRRSRRLAEVIKPVLEATVQINREYLRANPSTPNLYDSGVRYQNEPARINQNGIEMFDIIPVMLRRGWGDCDDLAPWRVAELQERFGEPASIRIQWKARPGRGKLYHVLVRRGNVPATHPFSIEDPSRRLGMR